MEQECPKYKLPDFQDRIDCRKDMWLAMDLYKFLNEHYQNTDILELDMQEEIQQAKCDCFEIICKWISLLKMEE